MSEWPDQIWCCQFEVCPTREHQCFGEYAGAFVNVYVMASSSAECSEVAAGALQNDKFLILEHEGDATRISDLEWGETSAEFVEEFEAVVSDLSAQSPVQYGVFETYPKSRLDA